MEKQLKEIVHAARGFGGKNILEVDVSSSIKGMLFEGQLTKAYAVTQPLKRQATLLNCIQVDAWLNDRLATIHKRFYDAFETRTSEA
jgi:hypothetical protein